MIIKKVSQNKFNYFEILSLVTIKKTSPFALCPKNIKDINDRYYFFIILEPSEDNTTVPSLSVL